MSQTIFREDKRRLTTDFDCIRLGVASPEKIISWSYGEVKKPRDDQLPHIPAGARRPVLRQDLRAHQRLGVLVRQVQADEVQGRDLRQVRRGGHPLPRPPRADGPHPPASPSSHVWFFKGLPSRIGQLLDISLKNLERVLYFESYIILDPGTSGHKERELLTEDEFRAIRQENPDNFRTGMGAEAIREILARMDMEEMSKDLREKMRAESSHMKKIKHAKRLKVVDSFRKSGNKPEWMILTVVPVIPPELRPLVPLDGGRFATSDLNDLYRRVLNPQQPAQEAAGAARPRGHHPEREAHAAGGGGRAVRQRPARPRDPRFQQPAPKSLSDNLKGSKAASARTCWASASTTRAAPSSWSIPSCGSTSAGCPRRWRWSCSLFIYHRLEALGYASTVKSARRWWRLSTRTSGTSWKR